MVGVALDPELFPDGGVTTVFGGVVGSGEGVRTFLLGPRCFFGGLPTLRAGFGTLS